MRLFGEYKPGAIYAVRKAAYVVVLDDQNRVALVEEKGRLFLPGGGSLPGEPAEITARREVMEECGRRIRIEEPLGEAVQVFSTSSEDLEMTAVFYRASFESGEGLAERHPIIWLDATSSLRNLYHACHRWAIRRAAALPAVTA